MATFKIAFSLLFVAFSSGVKVDLFRDMDYRGLIYEYRSALTEECHTVDVYGRGDVGSLKSDTCLMVYEEPNCIGNSFKVTRDNPDVSDLRRFVSSFHQCNDSFGGDIIRVDMFDDGGNLVAEYKDVCGCQDLPSQVTSSLFSINNYGNCITVYATDSCLGSDQQDIQPGRNGFSQNLPSLGYYVRSISGCGQRRACVKLSAKVFKFTIETLDSEDSADQPSARDAELGAKTYFYNNGSATLTQVYEARRLINETSTTSMSKTVSRMDYSEVSVGFSWEIRGKMDIPGVEEGSEAIGKVQASIGQSLGVAYKQVTELGKTERSSFTQSHEKEYAIVQRFEVPPCVEYTVSSTVTMVENLPIIYEVYVMVQGSSSGNRLTAEEVSIQVDGMTFVEIYDEYTAIFKTAEKLVANMGVETKISGQGKPIPGCTKDSPSFN